MIAKGNHAEALEIIPKILAHGLLIHTARLGTAAYAYYVDMVPAYRSHEPMVVFEVDEKYVENKPAPIPHKLPTYAFMKMYASGLTHIPLHVLGFVNVLEPLLPIYNGPIGFF